MQISLSRTKYFGCFGAFSAVSYFGQSRMAFVEELRVCYISKGRDKSLPSCHFFFSHRSIIPQSTRPIRHRYPLPASISLNFEYHHVCTFGVQFEHSLEFPTQYDIFRWHCDALPCKKQKTKRQNSRFGHARSWRQKVVDIPPPFYTKSGHFQFTKSRFCWRWKFFKIARAFGVI